MIDDHFENKVREYLADKDVTQWRGSVFRHMLLDFPPDKENRSGARWNPKEIPSIYCALTREGALAEANYRIGLEPIPLKQGIRRTIYTIELVIDRVVTLELEELFALGVSRDEWDSFDYKKTQVVGGLADWYEWQGILVPSPRHAGLNLVLFPNNSEGWSFQVTNEERL